MTTLTTTIQTNPKFWDCECYQAYIHHDSMLSCARCGAYRDEQPDSYENEVKTHLQEALDEILKGFGNAIGDVQQMCASQPAHADLRIPVVFFLWPDHLLFYLGVQPTARELVQAAELAGRNVQLRAAFQTAICQAAVELQTDQVRQEGQDG